jgi:hypothetical protein
MENPNAKTQITKTEMPMKGFDQHRQEKSWSVTFPASRRRRNACLEPALIPKRALIYLERARPVRPSAASGRQPALFLETATPQVSSAVKVLS